MTGCKIDPVEKKQLERCLKSRGLNVSHPFTIYLCVCVLFVCATLCVCVCERETEREREREKEGNVLFNDALNTFYLRLYGVRHMVKDHSDSDKGNPLPPHRILFPINSKGSFICTIRQTG